MGSGASANVKAEAKKPLDASDLKSDDAAAAIEEVKRLRGLLHGALNGNSPDLPSDLAVVIAKHAASSDESTVLKNAQAWIQERLDSAAIANGPAKSNSFGRQVSAGSIGSKATIYGQHSMLMKPSEAIREAQSLFNSPDNNEPLSEEKQQAYKEAFALFDKNGDGTVSVDELAEVMKSLDENPTAEELTSMIAEVDDNNNGTIDFQEFVALMGRQMTRVKAAAQRALLAARAKKNMMLFDVNPTEEAMEIAKCEKCAIHSQKDSASVDIEDLSVKEDNFEFQPVFEHAVAVDTPYELQKDLQSGLEMETLGGKKEGQQVLHDRAMGDAPNRRTLHHTY